MLVFVLALVSNAALAEVVSYADAASHVGRSVTVEGPVAEVFISRRGNTFLDIGAAYPNQKFSGVIFSTSASVVGDVGTLQGKIVDITGTVTMYHGKPEIIITSHDQIGVK